MFDDPTTQIRGPSFAMSHLLPRGRRAVRYSAGRADRNATDKDSCDTPRERDALERTPTATGPQILAAYGGRSPQVEDRQRTDVARQQSPELFTTIAIDEVARIRRADGRDPLRRESLFDQQPRHERPI